MDYSSSNKYTWTQNLIQAGSGRDVVAISNLFIHNYIPDQTLFRAVGVVERLQKAIATPRAHESQDFLQETYEYFRKVVIGPSIASFPMISAKAVCETTGELIGVSLVSLEVAADSHWLQSKYAMLFLIISYTV